MAHFCIPIRSDSNNSVYELGAALDGNKHQLKDFTCPENLTPSENADFQRFLDILGIGDEDDFLQQYSSLKSLENYNHIQRKLLIAAINTNKLKAFNAILCNVSDISLSEVEEGGKYPNVMEAVCRAGNLETLKKILVQHNLTLPNMMEILKPLITHLKEDLFNEWFDFLYDFKKFDVNEVDVEHGTLLELAIRQQNNTAIQKLCMVGAYLRTKSSIEALEELFDSCITSNNYNFKSKEFEITFNYTIFVPHEEHNDVNEMTLITQFLNSEQFSILLKHPLIASFMTLKWQCISRFVYLNFILYTFYSLSMVAYIIFMCEHFGSNSVAVKLTWWLTILGIVWLQLRQFVHLMAPIEYLSTPRNYIELVLIILSIRVITMDFERPNERIIVVCTILLMSTEFYILIAYMPIFSISTHMLMLKEVLKTFLKSFSSYSIFVLTFGLCFYVLFKTEHSFQSILKSIVKMMTMLVGELDFDGLNFEGACSYILFLMFVICMTIVLMNLLNGLAVSDIQAIRNQAEIHELICLAKLLKNNNSSELFFPRCYDEQLNDKYKKYCSCKFSLSVQPNAEGYTNKVIFPIECDLCSDKENIAEKQEGNCCRCFNNEYVRHMIYSWKRKCTVMGSSIVKSATKILTTELKSPSYEEIQLGNIENKMYTMEMDVKSIQKNVEKILEYMQFKNQ